VLAFFLTAFAVASWGGLPAGYEVGEATRSPDGRYALLYPVRDAVEDRERPNLLVQLEPYKVLAEIVPGVPQGATMAVSSEWNGTAMVAISQVRRWGLAGLWIYELDGDKVARVHAVLEEARKIFRQDFQERLLKKFPDETETIIFVSGEGEETPVPEFAFRGRKLHLDLVADNKPNLAPGPHWTARLEAVWDLDRGRFEKTRLHRGKIEMREP
jgi:hypothetical protein